MQQVTNQLTTQQQQMQQEIFTRQEADKQEILSKIHQQPSQQWIWKKVNLLRFLGRISKKNRGN